MQKLVVTIEHPGDYECDCHTEHLPVEYESAEAFLAHLEAGFVGWNEGIVAYRKESAAWHKARPRSNARQDRLEAWYAEMPKLPEVGHEIRVGANRFMADLFCTHHRNGEISFRAPMVRTLEEWFDHYAATGRNGIYG